MELIKAFEGLLNTGISDNQSIEKRKQIFVVNVLLLATGIIGILLGAINFFHGLYITVLLNISVVMFVSVLGFILQRFKLFFFTNFLLISLVSLIVILASLVAFSEGRYTETENLLIPISLIAIIVFDGRAKNIGYLAEVGLLAWLKYMKIVHYSVETQSTLTLTMVNIGVIFLIQYFIVNTYKSSLRNSVSESEESRKILFSLIDNVPLHMAIIDTSKRYKMVNYNYVETFGMERERIIGEKFDKVLPSNLSEVHGPLIDNVINSGQEESFLLDEVLPGGKRIISYGKYVPVFDQNGKMDSITVFVNDISKLKETEKELTEANKTKNRLFSIIAHDIKSPLNLFTSMLEIDEGDLPEQERAKLKDHIKKKLFALNDTIDNLLNWAKSQMEGMVSYPEKTNLKSIIDDNLILFEDVIKSKNIKLRFNAPEPEYEAFIDINHVKIIIRNILHNALKFTNDESIEISLTKDKEKISLEVKDHGIGIKPEMLTSIQKGSMVASVEGTSGEMGTGIGLQLVMELLKKNKSNFKIDSIRGKGTHVNIEIPRSR